MTYKRCDTANDSVGLAALQNVDCSISSQELANLENLIRRPARLKKKQAELNREINRVHSPFIRMIPAEIISRISEFANTDFAILGSLPTSILLSSVCSDWRRIVIGTPQLWSSIKINLYNFMASSELSYLATFIHQWLARSGQLALHISLYSGYQNIDSEAHSLRKIFKILNHYSFRWHTLNIGVHPTLLPYLQPDRLPLLEQLNINSQPGMNVTLNFPSSPRLKSVGVTNISLSDIKIQWDNVTRISTTFLDDISFSNIRWDNVTHISTMQLGSKIVLPSLRTLALFKVSSLEPLMACLKRSACSLHTLSLHLLVDSDNINRLLELLLFLSPSLTKLVISRPPVRIKDSGEYLSILAKTYSSQKIAGDSFLPHLEIFEYKEVFRSSMDFFDSANHPPARYSNGPISLCSAYIDLRAGHPPISQDILSILRQLNKDGILNISSTGDRNISLGAAVSELIFLFLPLSSSHVFVCRFWNNSRHYLTLETRSH